MKRNYVSNSTESVRLFRNDFLEALSKVHFTVPLFIYVPVIVFLSYKALTSSLSAGSYLLLLVFGIFIWTITEYVLHRFVFHFHPKSKIGKRIHFIFHGVHHDYPKDAKRLVMPPSASIPLALLFYLLFTLFFTNPFALYSFYSGFIGGYLVYDMTHYAIHHFPIKHPLFLKLKQHHALHHYSDPDKGFGVSSVVWDRIFNSDFPKKK